MVTGSHLEVERVFSPGEHASLPDLTAAVPVSRVEPVGEAELDATYYDTPGLALISAGVTLRRREGGADEGWHLKLPVDVPDARRELHQPLGDGPDSPPDGLLELVAGWTRGIAVAPVARIRTTRSTHRLVGADGAVLAELADDRVVGHPAQLDAEPVRWREWELELVDGDAELLDAVEEILAAHDVRRSEVTRKVAIVLDADLGPREAPPVPRKKDPARLHLHRWLVAQVGELAALDPVTRRHGPGGVHGMRKACRRLRAALAAYRPLVDRKQTEPLREELRWLARSLGPARDDEVILERIAKHLDDEDHGLADPARALLDQYAAGRAAEDGVDVDEVLGSARYFALRTALDQLVADPPWTDKAERPARTVFPKRLDREWQRVRDRHDDGDDPHEVRKAAKRLRYALELVEPAWGKKARRPRKAARDLTQVLGEAQDSQVARSWLEGLAAEAARSGVPSYSFGRLHALEEQAERVALGEAGAAWRKLEKAVSRW